ncbi:Sugar-specific transcriptional regulator TrmB [Candidatus Burarchaeum australiense]|nr:Sugar-specific transcriptional regulator TrmB [Candidatus Burarchaeum australiense]
MAKIEEALAGLGLTPNDVKVYLALLEVGATTSGAIVRRSGLHVPRVYEALERLEAKGLASHVLRNNKRHFEAAEPARLLDIVNRQNDLLKGILPELASRRKTAERREEVATIYQGVRGIRSVLNSILDELRGGGEYVDFGVSGLFRQIMGPYWDVWQKEKKRRRVQSKCIFDENLRGSRLFKDYYGAARFFPSKYHCPSDTIIYGDNVVTFIWAAEPPTAILIKDKTMALGYRNIFRWMWEKAAKYGGDNLLPFNPLAHHLQPFLDVRHGRVI